MTVKEGKGLVAPTPAKVRVRGSEVRQLNVIAKERNKHRNYGSSNSSWKRGSCANPILIGLVGEYALQQLLTRRLGQGVQVVDDKLNSGDGGVDLVIFGVRYQVKTSRRVYKTVLVRRINRMKQLVSHTSERFVFCAWNELENDCQIIGWCTRETLREHGKLMRPKTANADWWNSELETKWLESVDSLIRQMKLEREEQVDGAH